MSIKTPCSPEDRRRRGICTERQAAVLKRFGLNPLMDSDDAHWVIGTLKTNGWTVPALISEQVHLLDPDSPRWKKSQ